MCETPLDGWVLAMLPVGNLLHSELENHRAINGKIHYKWAIFHSNVKLPEGINVYNLE